VGAVGATAYPEAAGAGAAVPRIDAGRAVWQAWGLADARGTVAAAAICADVAKVAVRSTRTGAHAAAADAAAALLVDTAELPRGQAAAADPAVTCARAALCADVAVEAVGQARRLTEAARAVAAAALRCVHAVGAVGDALLDALPAGTLQGAALRVASAGIARLEAGPFAQALGPADPAAAVGASAARLGVDGANPTAHAFFAIAGATFGVFRASRAVASAVALTTEPAIALAAAADAIGLARKAVTLTGGPAARVRAASASRSPGADVARSFADESGRI